MAREAPLVEVDPSHLTRAEWARILWGVLLRGSRYTLPPLLVVIVTLAVFGVVVGIIALKVGISPHVIEQYDFVFELVGDLLSAVIGIYVFARNLRSLPKVQLGRYRFALVRSDEPSSETRSAV
jgi:ABC-type antimicrobial peptide transport system permease subunit